MKSRNVNFRCPIALWKEMKKQRSENTEGLLRLLRMGMELEKTVKELGDDLDQLAAITGYDRATVIQECVRGMIELASTPEKKAITPVLLEAYAVGLKKAVGKERLELLDADPNPPFRSKVLRSRVKRDYRITKARIAEAESQAERVRLPFVRASK